jgi:GNAT superfamily N-acetyltransferase
VKREPPVPPVIIEEAKVDDAEYLTRLAFASKRHWGYDDAFMERCRSELTVPASHLEDRPAYVARCADRILGFYTLVAAAGAACMELDMLFVEPTSIGDGVGGALMRHAVNVARDLGASTLRIIADPFAAPFYEHFGARLIGASTSPSTGRSLPIYEMSLGEGRDPASIT